jgi:hypothetical protein
MPDGVTRWADMAEPSLALRLAAADRESDYGRR